MSRLSLVLTFAGVLSVTGCDLGISYFQASPPSNAVEATETIIKIAPAKALDVPGTYIFDASQMDQIATATIEQNNSNFVMNSDKLIVLNVPPAEGLSTDFVIHTPGKRTLVHVAVTLSDQAASVPVVWGQNRNGNVLLSGSTGVASPSPIAAALTSLPFKQIAASRAHACGLTADGSAYCWGEGDYGRLGTNAQTDSATPLAVVTTEKFRAIAVAGANWGGDRAHTCAINLVGKVYCWGRNASGQLGNNSNVDSLMPVAVASSERFVGLALAASSSCGLTESGKVYCWGANDHGQLGQGTTTQSAVPTLLSGSYSAIATGMDAFCGIQTSTAHVVCWGVRDRGATTYIADFSSSTVDDAMPFVLSPTLLDASRAYTSLSGGASSFCALSRAQDAYCWGYEMYGRIGLGSQQFYAVYYTPQKVAGTTKFKSISCGQSMTIAIDENDELYGWGHNENGELGVGFITTGSSPLPVEGPYGIYSPYKLDSSNTYFAISVGDDFAFALRK